jgi:hypothetical protein
MIELILSRVDAGHMLPCLSVCAPPPSTVIYMRNQEEAKSLIRTGVLGPCLNPNQTNKIIKKKKKITTDSFDYPKSCIDMVVDIMLINHFYFEKKKKKKKAHHSR